MELGLTRAPASPAAPGPPGSVRLRSRDRGFYAGSGDRLDAQARRSSGGPRGSGSARHHAPSFGGQGLTSDIPPSHA